MPDIFQSVDDLDVEMQQLVAGRLEMRAALPKFGELRDAYFRAIDLSSFSGNLLEIGCGTGAVCRAIARWPGFSGKITGSDLSENLILQARALAEQEGLNENVQFIVADGQESELQAGSFDIVIAHTVISHVEDPDALLAEMLRLTRPGGQVVVHDADYASLTFDTGAPELDRELPKQYSKVLFANPRIMRELPRRLKRQDATLRDCIAGIFVEVGDAAYFPGVAGYGPAVVNAGLATSKRIESWQQSIARAVQEQTFFASCNYMTYLIEKPAA